MGEKTRETLQRPLEQEARRKDPPHFSPGGGRPNRMSKGAGKEGGKKNSIAGSYGNEKGEEKAVFFRRKKGGKVPLFGRTGGNNGAPPKERKEGGMDSYPRKRVL